MREDAEQFMRGEGHSMEVELRVALIALRDKWRAEAALTDRFHATMGTGWKVCADDLDAFLACVTDGETINPTKNEV